MAENKNALPLGTILNARYEIESLVGGGGFGLVYQARHTHLNIIVAIKELFPRDIVVRQGKIVHPVSQADIGIYQKVLNSFRKEGKRLASLGNCSSIVQCSDYFEENDTGYLVMEYISGRSLRAIVRSYRESDKTFSEASLISLLSELLKGLKEVHKADIQHMDIKPENIYIREAEGADELSNPMLLDFGASLSQTGHSTSSSLLVGTPPYAPIEQMHTRGDMGPWTDIYALGITLYELMFGVDEIPNCMERISDIHSEGVDPLTPAKSRDTKQYSESFLILIDDCIAIKVKDRPQNVEEVESLLTAPPLPKPKLISKTSKVKFEINKVPPAIIIICIMLVVVIGWNYIDNLIKQNDFVVKEKNQGIDTVPERMLKAYYDTEGKNQGSWTYDQFQEFVKRHGSISLMDETRDFIYNNYYSDLDKDYFDKVSGYSEWKDSMPNLISNIARGAGEFTASHWGAGLAGTAASIFQSDAVTNVENIAENVDLGAQKLESIDSFSEEGGFLDRVTDGELGSVSLFMIQKGGETIAPYLGVVEE